MHETVQSEMSRFFEEGHNPIRLRDGIGNSTIATILEELQLNHTLGDEKSIPAISRFLGCFQPITDPMLSPSNNVIRPESLWDQTAAPIMSYQLLDQKDQEQMNGMVDTLLWSLAYTQQERKVRGGIRDVSPHVRELATTIGETTDTWKHITEPQKKWGRAGFLQKIPLPVRISAGLTVAAVILEGCARPTPIVSPDITPTRPAITQPISSETPTQRPATPTTKPATVTQRAPEVTFLTTQSGLEKSVMTTKLDASLFDNIDKTHAPNAAILLKAMKARFAEVAPNANPNTIEATYVCIKDPKTGFVHELAIAPFATEDVKEYAVISFVDANGKIMTGGAVWNPKEELNGKAVGTLRFLGPDNKTLGDPIYAIYESNGRIMVVLFDINNPTNLDKALFLDAGKVDGTDSDIGIGQSVNIIRALTFQSLLAIDALFLPPAPDFKVGMTAEMTMADCNKLDFADLDTQMAALTTKYEELGLTPDQITSFYNHSNGINRFESVPWSYAELSVSIKNPQVISCGVLHMPDGTDMLTITLPMKTPGGNQIIPMTFAIDDEGMKAWYTAINSLEKGYALNSAQTVFKNLLEAIRSKKSLYFTIRPWISTQFDNTGLIPQWENSEVLMGKNNAVGTPYLTHIPSPDEVTRMQISEALDWFVTYDETYTPELVQALIDRLKNTVFPVEILNVRAKSQ